ncbi:MAG: hypothetical protein K0R09_1014 [Clostridiales bacterium]|jgi:hypothetical protein|nr:hypothetical protein [Clostridiales bacterium]
MEKENLKITKYKVAGVLKNSANWFYWIAGLSLVNTLVIVFGGEMSFVVGLGITQLIDIIAYYISQDAGNLVTIIAVVLDLLIAGIFVLFGYFSNKGYKWSFFVGMVLYGLDGLIFIFLKDFLSLAFHGYAIYCIYKGVKAIKVLKEIQEYENQNGDTTEDIYEGKTETQINYLKQMNEVEDK